MKPSQNYYTSSRYRALFLTILGIVSVLLIASAWSIQNDSRLLTRTFALTFKQFFYETTFYVENTLGTANVYNSTAATRTATSERARSVPVLVYHGILDRPDGSTINVTTEQFKEHLFNLKRAGYETLTLHELYEYGRNGTPLPESPLVITFDDGRADSYYNGDPILNAVDFTASMFVITGLSSYSESGSYYLSPVEISRMHRTERWEIGSHSHNGHATHPVDDRDGEGNFFSYERWLKDEARTENSAEYHTRIHTDFRTSQQYLENLLGQPVRTLAFPFGDFGQHRLDARDRTRTVIRTASEHYDILFYQHEPGAYYTQYTHSPQPTPSLLVRRINIDASWDAGDLLQILSQGNYKPLPYDDTFETNNGWVSVWGQPVFEDGAMTLSAAPQSTGASTILDGSETWRDYEITLEAASPNRTGFFVWTRFQTDDMNAGCNFGTTFVHAEQVVKGEKRVLTGIQLEYEHIPEEPFIASARVEGRTLICSLNGTELVRSEFLDPELTRGGVGIKVWDVEHGKSSLTVNRFTATALTSEPAPTNPSE